MCFSATVSFGASALIGTTGVIAYNKAQTKPQKAFAAIPLFFAVQQFAEGLTWLSLSNSNDTSYDFLMPGSSYAFLFFAWIVFPFFIPLVMYGLEKDPGRKSIIQFILIVGTLVSMTLAYVLIRYPVETYINGHHIDYEAALSHPLTWALSVFYIIATVFACLFSSVKKMWILGVINLASYAFSKIMFSSTVISIWCFFAAISSVLILIIITELVQDKSKKAPVLA